MAGDMGTGKKDLLAKRAYSVEVTGMDAVVPSQISKTCLPAYIARWRILISGFMQHLGEPTGMDALFADLNRRLSSGRTRVELRCWNDRWPNLAEFIWRQRAPNNGADVCIFGYSWGGASSMILARELGRRGIAVRAMVLTDAVYRNWWLPWRVFCRWPRIVVPPNVREVFWFRQRNDWPSGHKLVAADPERTAIRPAVLVPDRGHSYMDELPNFRRKCLEVAQGGAHES
jgi:pimeloyl-ACP methyl ester carboxylesterase